MSLNLHRLALAFYCLALIPPFLAEINAPMANHSKAAQKRRTPSKQAAGPVLKFEIIHENSNLGARAWTKVRRNLEPFVEVGRNALGDIYASAAQAVLERMEEFEDRRAERQARQRIAARAAGKRAISAPKTHPTEAGARPKNRSASPSKSSA
jgi:hypothetical protein